MVTVLVLYYFSHGHVEKLAHKIAASAREAVASADMKHVLELLSLEAAKAVNYNLIRPVQPRALTTSPNTRDRRGYRHAFRRDVAPRGKLPRPRGSLWAKGEPSMARQV